MRSTPSSACEGIWLCLSGRRLETCKGYLKQSTHSCACKRGLLCLWGSERGVYALNAILCLQGCLRASKGPGCGPRQCVCGKQKRNVHKALVTSSKPASLPLTRTFTQ